MQVAVVSLTNAVFVMYMAIAQLLGIGGSAVISILLGRGEKEEAKSASEFCFYSSLILGVIVCVVVLLFMEPLLTILGINIRKRIYTTLPWEHRLFCLPIPLVMQ